MANDTKQATTSAKGSKVSKGALPILHGFSLLVSGQGLSADYLLKHWAIIATVMAFLMLNITNKYYSQTSMEEIAKLKRTLEEVRTERVRAKSEYMSRTRESSMQTLLDTLHLNLGVQTRPPFILTEED